MIVVLVAVGSIALVSDDGCVRADSTYTVTEFYPLDIPPEFSSNYLASTSGIATSGGQSVGDAAVPVPNGPSDEHAVLWANQGASIVSLNPDGFYFSVAGPSGPDQQVGYGFGSATQNQDHALLWSGTANSAVDLNPSGFTYSEANGGNGSQQVGDGGDSATGEDHALLWADTAASAIDLNPAGYAYSQAYGTDGTQQVGFASGTMTNNIHHAFLWSGTAASAIDLNPTGLNYSVAAGIDGNQEVGDAGIYNVYSHAMLWSGTADSGVDLNPVGFAQSSAIATNGVEQVGSGYGSITANNLHALVWSGSADSVVDLNSFLPGTGRYSAVATGIDANGNIYGVVLVPGSIGYDIEWSPVPEPTSVALWAGGGVALLTRRRRPTPIAVNCRN